MYRLLDLGAGALAALATGAGLARALGASTTAAEGLGAAAAGTGAGAGRGAGAGATESMVGATVCVGVRVDDGGSNNKVYSRTRRPEDQARSRITSMKGS